MTVGYDGSGGGTFLWDDTTTSFQAALELAGLSLSALPAGFFQVPYRSPGPPPLPEEYQQLLLAAFGDAVNALNNPDFKLFRTDARGWLARMGRCSGQSIMARDWTRGKLP